MNRLIKASEVLPGDTVRYDVTSGGIKIASTIPVARVEPHENGKWIRLEANQGNHVSYSPDDELTLLDRPTPQPSGAEPANDPRIEAVQTGNPIVSILSCRKCGVLIWDIDAHYGQAHPSTQDHSRRPTPQLPTEPGSVIVAYEVRGERNENGWRLMYVGCDVFAAGPDNWISETDIAGAIWHYPENITSWLPATVTTNKETGR